MKLSDRELAAMPAKTKKDPEVVALYQERDYLEAYAMHTDRRVERTGYKAAVGSCDDNWELHGDLQRAFLIGQGLRPEHTLLEIGCGTGRLARKIVPYLEPGHYTGVDISAGALEAAMVLGESEGWSARCPRWYRGQFPVGAPVDFLWSFSVFIHLPAELMREVMQAAALTMHERSRFYFSYVPEPKDFRSGVKQFRKTLETHKRAAAAAGLTFAEVPDWIRRAGFKPSRETGGQRVALATLSN